MEALCQQKNYIPPVYAMPLHQYLPTPDGCDVTAAASPHFSYHSKFAVFLREHRPSKTWEGGTRNKKLGALRGNIEGRDRMSTRKEGEKGEQTEIIILV